MFNDGAFQVENTGIAEGELSIATFDVLENFTNMWVIQF